MIYVQDLAMVDRRKDLRAVVRLEVEPGAGSLKRPPFYITGNISVGGMFLITSDPLPEKTKIALQFRLPDDEEKIQVLAEVVWCREKDERPGLPPGMGIKFLKISDKDREKIDRFVKGIYEKESQEKGIKQGGEG